MSSPVTSKATASPVDSQGLRAWENDRRRPDSVGDDYEDEVESPSERRARSDQQPRSRHRQASPRRTLPGKATPEEIRLRIRFHTDARFHAAVHIYSKLHSDGYTDDDGVRHSGPTLADAEMVERLEQAGVSYAPEPPPPEATKP